MHYDISAIKKLPTKEKLRIIDELWKTIDKNELNAEKYFEESPEVMQLLQERVEKYERGEGKSYAWEEAKKILLSNLDKNKDE